MLSKIHVFFIPFLFLCQFAWGQEDVPVDTLVVDSHPYPDKILIGMKESPPFLYTTETGELSGISLQLWEIIAQDLNIEYEFKKSNLQEILSDLEQNCIDLCINPLTVTSARIKKVDFTQPFFTANSAIVTREKAGTDVVAFIKGLFSFKFLKTLLLLLILLLCFGIATWFFERRKNPEEFQNNIRGLWSGLWWSAVTMTTVGYGDKSPRSTGGRFIALIWMFTAVIVISSFTASITSALTIEQLGSNIDEISDLRGMKVGTVSKTATESFLQHNYIKSIGFETIEEGLTSLSEGKLDAFVYDEPIARFYIDRLGLERLQILPNKFNPQYYSFSLPKHSELARYINPVLLGELEEVSWKLILTEYGLNDF